MNLSSNLTANGEVIVTLLPTNEKLPWIMPAKFRPELVPEELMAPVLTVNKVNTRKYSSSIESYSILSMTWIVLPPCFVFTVNSRGICTNNGETDDRYEIHTFQYLLQENIGNMDHAGVCNSVKPIVLGFCGKLVLIKPS